MTEQELYFWLLAAWLVVACGVFAVLHFVTAPYGRHARKGWGPTVHRTLGWVVMESPAVWGIILLFVLGNRMANPVAIAFLAIWLLHYVNRTLVFPFRMRGGQLRMPVMIMSMGFVFNLMNAYVQGRGLFYLVPAYTVSWFGDPRFIGGLVLFLVGMSINLHSDSVLRNLRRPGETAYRIPTGGAYRFVSCPNYFGELLEWAGWAMLTWSVAGVVFLLWTAANLIPRALANHRWYREHFDDYPRQRKAVVPFLL